MAAGRAADGESPITEPEADGSGVPAAGTHGSCWPVTADGPASPQCRGRNRSAGALPGARGVCGDDARIARASGHWPPAAHEPPAAQQDIAPRQQAGAGVPRVGPGRFAPTVTSTRRVARALRTTPRLYAESPEMSPSGRFV
jgi:hypothetical protein